MKDLYTTKDWATLKELVKKHKKTGDKLVFTNGCFDILHPGHEALLTFVRNQGGLCVLGLNSDSSLRKLKGPDRPVNPEAIRAKKLLATGYIDAVVIYSEDTPQKIINYLEPDVLIKGGDYQFENIVGAREVEARGGQVLVFPRIPGHSTTEILATEIKNSETNKG